VSELLGWFRVTKRTRDWFYCAVWPDVNVVSTAMLINQPVLLNSFVLSRSDASKLLYSAARQVLDRSIYSLKPIVQ
jgi:hypothetical protein